MIPLNTFTPDPELGDFLPPNDNDYYPLFQVVRGGTEIGNNSAGRDIQDWQVYYQQGIIHIKPSSGDVVFTLSVNNVLSVSLAFDTAMRIVLTWTTPLGAKLYFYDTLTLDYIIVDYDEVTSSRVTVDKIDTWYNSSSDVLFLYIKNNNLYYRQQRDRYEIEYLIGEANGYIKRAGLTKLNRFQIDISEVQYAQTNINVLVGIYVPITLSGPVAQIPKCIIVPDELFVNEGDTITYTLTTEYVSDGTVLEFKKYSGTAVDADFNTPLTGTVSIQNNSGAFSLDVKNDILVEGVETITMSLNISGKTTTLAKSPMVTIGDTTPVPTSTPTSTPDPTSTPVPTYSISTGLIGSVGGSYVTEGQTINFTVNTTNVANGTRFYFQTKDNSAGLGTFDLTYSSSTSIGSGNNFIVNNNIGTFNVQLLNDNSPEGTESFKITMHDYAAWVAAGSVPNMQFPALATSETIIVNDIAAPTYTLTSNTVTLTEGGSVATFYVNTTNVPNGTRLNFSTFNNSDGLGWYDINWSSPTSNGTVGDRQLANLAIYNNYATFTVWAVQDNILENQESFKVQLTPFGSSQQLALSETIYLGPVVVERIQ